MSVVQVALLLAAVSCHALANPGNYFYGGAAPHLGEQYAYPKYNYDYGVHSPHTGDVKNQWETRDGDVVKGSYSFNEADGTIRQVEYTADEHNGFNAVVKKLGKAVHPHAVQHYGGTGLGGAYNGGEHYEAGHLGSSSYVSVKHASGHQPGSYYGTQKLGGEFFGAGHLGEASSYANGNLHSFSHYGGHIGGHFAGATSHANSNSLSINHYGAPRYSVGHLGVRSYDGGYNGAVGHHGNHHYY